MLVDPRIARAKAAIRRARLYTWCNRLIRWLPNIYCAFVLLFLAGVWVAVKRSEYYGSILALPTAAAGLLSGLAYPCSLILRDSLDRGGKFWRFNLRYLLSVMTGAAIVMGVLSLAFKHLK